MRHDNIMIINLYRFSLLIAIIFLSLSLLLVHCHCTVKYLNAMVTTNFFLLWFSLLVLLLCVVGPSLAFTRPFCTRHHYSSRLALASEPIKGDPLREATGIRPSLHPTTINAIAEALKARSIKKPGMEFRVSDTVQPLQIALTGGKIAAKAITKRKESSDQDGMQLDPKEEETIAGRVLGVIMRLDELEVTLYEKVSNVGWVAKYDEWASFGVLKTEESNDLVDKRIKDDPLFCMSRAECLLAIFLKTVEIPQLTKVGGEVPDGSKIDFLDEDRSEVLL